MKKLILLILFLVGCSTYPHYSNPKKYCKDRFSRDVIKQEECMDEQFATAYKLYKKLIYFGVMDEDGKTITKSSKEFKIYRYCFTKWYPMYDRIDFCFDYYIDGGKPLNTLIKEW